MFSTCPSSCDSLYRRPGGFGPFENEPPSLFTERRTYLFLLLGLGVLGLVLIAANAIGGIVMVAGMVVALFGRYKKKKGNGFTGTMTLAKATSRILFYLSQGGGFTAYLIGLWVTVM